MLWREPRKLGRGSVRIGATALLPCRRCGLTAAEVFAKTAQALAEVLGMEVEEVTPSSTLVGDLEATSLDVVDLMFQLKKAFGIEITLADAQRELGGASGAPGESSQGFDDALFEKITVQDLANWVQSRFPV